MKILTNSGIASSSGDYGTAYASTGAFDNAPSTFWVSKFRAVYEPSWISYDFGRNVTIKRYTLNGLGGTNIADRLPYSWELQAWIGSSWVTIDSQSGMSMLDWQSTVLYKEFDLSSTVTSSRFRLYIFENNGSEVTALSLISFFNDTSLEYTTGLENFLTTLHSEVTSFTEEMSTLESTFIGDKKLNILKYELAMMYYSIIEHYFESPILNDTNFMSVEDLQIIIDKLNNIMNTHLYVEL